MGSTIGASISANAVQTGRNPQSGSLNRGGGATTGRAGGSLGFESADRGTTTEVANASIDIVNYDVRSAISNAERAASRSSNPEEAFSTTLSTEILGDRGLRNRYLENADSGRGTSDPTGPLTSIEQSSILNKGRFSNDLASGPFDGDPTFKERREK